MKKVISALFVMLIVVTSAIPVFATEEVTSAEETTQVVEEVTTEAATEAITEAATEAATEAITEKAPAPIKSKSPHKVKSPRVESPEATCVPDNRVPAGGANTDGSITAPKTGFDYTPFVVTGVSMLAFAAVALVYVKSYKKSK